jgi:hypothetical protein
LFVLLAVASATGNDTVRLVAGYQGLVTGALAIYAGMRQVVKDVYQRGAMAV